MLFSIESANIIKPLIFLVQKSCIFKIKSYLCNAFNKSTSERKFGRGGRVVDCGGLENRCTARYPGFESLSLRWKELQNKENPCKLILYGDFLFLVHSKNKHIKAFFRCTLLRITCKIWRVLQSCFHFASESILLHGTIHTYVQGYICVRTVLCVHM